MSRSTTPFRARHLALASALWAAFGMAAAQSASSAGPTAMPDTAASPGNSAPTEVAQAGGSGGTGASGGGTGASGGGTGGSGASGASGAAASGAATGGETKPERRSGTAAKARSTEKSEAGAGKADAASRTRTGGGKMSAEGRARFDADMAECKQRSDTTDRKNCVNEMTRARNQGFYAD